MKANVILAATFVLGSVLLQGWHPVPQQVQKNVSNFGLS
jgi:hypothetical protein